MCMCTCHVLTVFSGYAYSVLIVTSQCPLACIELRLSTPTCLLHNRSSIPAVSADINLDTWPIVCSKFCHPWLAEEAALQPTRTAQPPFSALLTAAAAGGQEVLPKKIPGKNNNLYLYNKNYYNLIIKIPFFVNQNVIT